MITLYLSFKMINTTVPQDLEATSALKQKQKPKAHRVPENHIYFVLVRQRTQRMNVAGLTFEKVNEKTLLCVCPDAACVPWALN